MPMIGRSEMLLDNYQLTINGPLQYHPVSILEETYRYKISGVF